MNNDSVKFIAFKKLNDFFSGFREQKFKKGQVILEAMEEPSGVFYLTDGVIRQYSISPKGEEITLNLFKSISFFPISWVLNDGINPHYFEAMTPITVRKAPKEKVLKLLKEDPEVLFDLAQRIYRGLEGFYLRMEHLMSGSAKNRLISELVIFAKRFGELSGDHTEVKLKLTEKELAAISGITRETVSRELHKLEKKDLLDFKKNTLIINNLSKLEEELEV